MSCRCWLTTTGCVLRVPTCDRHCRPTRRPVCQGCRHCWPSSHAILLVDVGCQSSLSAYTVGRQNDDWHCRSTMLVDRSVGRQVVWCSPYRQEPLIRLTLFVTPGWQRWSGTPNAPVTAAGADDDVPAWSVLDSVEPDPCRLNGFTLSFHVAACDPALADDTLSRDVWLGGEAPELGILCSFCFGEPTVSVTQYRLPPLPTAINHAAGDNLVVLINWHLCSGNFSWAKCPVGTLLGDVWRK